MLDDRLLCAASLVRPGSRVADIGTDHAYLPLYLVEQGLCPSAIASDVRPGPADSARRHVSEAGLSDRIMVRLGDGLVGIAPDEVDDIVIAGMGGETIAAILQTAPWVKSDRYRLVLQPMTRSEQLRRWLLTNGFTLLTERVTQDGKHLYTVIAAAYTGAPPVTEEVAYYRGALTGEDGAAFLAKEIVRLTKQQAGCRVSGNQPQADRLQQLIEQLEGSL